MQKTLIYIDINTKGQIDASGKAVKSSSLYPSFERGQWQVLCINFVQVSEDDLGVVTLTPYNLAGKSYLFVADNNFADDDSLMLKSYQSTTPFNETDPTSNRINIAGDWIDGGTADLEKGQMSIRINSDTAKFVEVLGNRVSLNSGLYINIKQYIAGLANPSSIAWIPFVAKNTVRDWGDAQETPPSGEQVVSFINAYFATPTLYEFSEDGTSWHAEQTDNDMYYRQRIDASGATWGSAIKLREGKGDKGDTGDAAGFGTPTASAVSVASGYPARVKVSASGPNTAKVFNLEFEIPQGEQGKRGEAFKIDATGTLVERSQYDSQPKDFSFLATDNGNVYIKASDTSGDWSDPIPFKGDKGDMPFNLRGEWVSSAEYYKDDAVTYNGSLYIALVSTSSTPGTDSSWLLYVSKGDTGKTGATGKQGERGATGHVENLKIEITDCVDGVLRIEDDNSFPVAVLTNAGKCYPIEKGSLRKAETGWEVIVAKYLAYDNVSAFTAPWYVYCAGGVPGTDGLNFTPDARGTAAERPTYDSQPKGFAFLAFDEGSMYFKNSDTAGDWSDAVPFRGEQGKRGLPGPMADITISDNGTWVVNGVDTLQSVRGKGANIIMSPTRPAEPYEGLIYIYDGDNEGYYDLDKLHVIKGFTPPETAEEGTVFLVEEAE